MTPEGLHQVAALAILVVAFVALVGYLFGVPRLERGLVTENITPMAIHTAAAFVVFATGALASRPEVGVVGLLRAPGPGGTLLRRLLLPALVLPVLAGALEVEGEQAGLVGDEDGAALFAAALLLVFGGLLWATARSLERTDARRRESDATQRAILGSALDVIVTVDHDGRILESNPAVEPTFGYAQADVVGMPIGELLALPGLEEGGSTTVAEFLSGGRSARVGEWEEMTGTRADGGTFVAEVSASRGDLPGGSFFAAYIRDISERKRAEEERLKLEQQLGQAQKMHAIGRLASGVAHDFNNLLTVIVGHTELLLGAHPDGNPDHEALIEIRDTAERAAALTGQILAFSRNRSPEQRILDLNAAVIDLAPLLRRLIEQDVELTIHCDPELGNIRELPRDLGAAYLESVVDLELGENGSIGVIVAGSVWEPRPLEVWAYGVQGPRLLDSGNIARDSLELEGSTLRWLKDGVQQMAVLE